MTLHHSERQGLAALARITVADMRAWMADQRGSGVGARSLARKLSAVKSFYRWLSDREGFEPTAVLSTRAPKFTKKLPRPLAEDAARAMIDTVELQSTHRTGSSARDGCSCDAPLRVRVADFRGVVFDRCATLLCQKRCASSGKGDKERIVPVLPAARASVDRYLHLCPHPQSPDKALFRGMSAVRPAQSPCNHSGLWSPRHGCNLAFPQQPPRTRCATALPPICCLRAATCARSKSFWVTPRFQPRRPIPQSIRPG